MKFLSSFTKHKKHTYVDEKEEVRKFEWEDNNVVFCFHTDSGPFAYECCCNYYILYRDGIYSCLSKVGWDYKNTFLKSSISEKHILRFFKNIEKIALLWNGFNESNEDILDGATVSLNIKFDKLNFDVNMKGYACQPMDFNKSADIIVSEYCKLLKNADESFKGEELIEYAISMKPIDKHVFRIGGEGVVPPNDFEIPGTDMIGHSYAELIKRDRRLYVKANRSMCRILFNGKEIPSDKEFELSYGVISFEDHKFLISTSNELYFRRI